MALRMKKRPEPTRKSLRSDGVDVAHTASLVGLTGRMIPLEKKGLYKEYRKLRKELGKLLQERDTIEADLTGCHDRDKADQLADVLMRWERDYETGLRDFIRPREERKLKIEARVKIIRERLEVLDPSFVGQPIKTLAFPPPEPSANFCEDFQSRLKCQ